MCKPPAVRTLTPDQPLLDVQDQSSSAQRLSNCEHIPAANGFAFATCPIPVVEDDCASCDMTVDM